MKTIETDTALVPSVIAENVYYELGVACTNKDIQTLCNMANERYNDNEVFRAKLKQRGNNGRDYLYAWMGSYVRSISINYNTQTNENSF